MTRLRSVQSSEYSIVNDGVSDGDGGKARLRRSMLRCENSSFPNPSNSHQYHPPVIHPPSDIPHSSFVTWNLTYCKPSWPGSGPRITKPTRGEET
ncbi:hypothetical protein BDW42DRAFT_179643 [Aspergillus taichungensis]|uniref:Uncharacterized protein n=1 Tax=Aspergillus taichungensis TaxID=482145 RepID=A0A2J5HG76_9EURO|nr:hypothetical protein BDW42DRAFT_179643 [Aspergillus taichungensis]